MKIIESLVYTKDHEWLREEDGKIYIGITDFAQGELGDIIFLESHEVGDTVDIGGSVATIEAVKTVADVYSPISGKIIEVNELLEEQPELINTDPYGDGWIACIESSTSINSIDTLSSQEYLNFIGK
tara:strand:- start:2263 stop:2643 length:381 start_codon:yes stop_codon:yes gene_type:complete